MTDQLEEIRQWRSAFRGHYFKCVPENAEVFERAIAEMVEHIDTLLSEIDRLKGEDVEAALAELREMLPTYRINISSGDEGWFNKEQGQRVVSGAKICIGLRPGEYDVFADATLPKAMQKVREWKGKQ